MVSKTLYEVCREVIDSQYNDFDANPVGYIESMGWNPKEPRFKHIAEIKDYVSFSKEQVEQLGELVLRLIEEGEITDETATTEIIQHDKTSDFVTNLIAGEILKQIEKN